MSTTTATDVRYPASRPRNGSAWDVPLMGAVLASFVALRAFSTALVVYIARHPVVPVGGKRPSANDPWSVLSSWDGRWYRHIALHGYPSQLPTRKGVVIGNPWAFLPLYPKSVRLVMDSTGASFPVAGVALATIAAALACVLIVPLLRQRVGRLGAYSAAVLVAAAPASPVLQMTYAESYGLLVLVLFLIMIDRERWLLAALALLVAGVTRPLALPAAAVVVVAIGVRVLQARPRPVGRGEALRMLAVLAAVVASVVAWPLWAAHRTGLDVAYTATEAAWHHGHSLKPFEALFHAARVALGPITGPLLVVAVGALYAALLLSPLATRLGPSMRTWCLSYAAFIAAAGGYVTSQIRFLLPLVPLGAVLVGSAARRQPPVRVSVCLLIVLMTLSLGAQVWWVTHLLRPVHVLRPI